jgi:hypothetical protein
VTRGAARLCAVGVAVSACGGPAVRPDPAPTVSAIPLTRVAVPEPAADDDVELVTGKGHVEPAVVEAAIAPRRDELTACYLDRVGKRRWLGGQLVLRWDVAADGALTQVVLAESDLGAWPIEKCVLELARAMTFGPPLGGAAEVVLPLTLAARGRAAQWDDAQAEKAVGAQLGKLDGCARGKIAAPDDVVITAYVGPRGRVQSVGFASPHRALDDAWAACAEKLVHAWHLPDPKGQITKLAVRYRPRSWTSSPRKSSS